MTDQKQLLNQYLNGDISSMTKLIEEYKDDLYNLSFRLTFSKFEADDLFQQTWEKAIRNSAKYNGSSFKNWIYTICINTHRDIIRRNSRRAKIGGIDFNKSNDKELAMSLASDGISAADLAEKNQTRIQLACLVNDLPTKHKAVVVLHYYQGLSYDEIAKILNVPQGTVKSRLNSAKRKLKTQLKVNAITDSSVREDELYVEYS